MQEIVAKYKTDDSPYLLPIAKGEGAIFWRQYKNAYSRITKQLKKIGEMIGLSVPLTTYGPPPPLRSPPLLGKHSQEQERARIYYQRGIGA